MSVSVMYNAIPIDSSLYARIQQENPLCYLVKNLTTYGGGLFDFVTTDPFDEIQDILESLVEAHPGIFGTQADLIISDFRAEIENTHRNYPGIETRTALIEKSFDEIKQCLVREFSWKQLQSSDQFVQELLMGDQSLAPNLLTQEDYPIGMVSYNLVQEGAKILESIDPDQIQVDVPYWSDWGLEHLKAWRDLYLMASRHREVILVSSE